MTSFLLSGISCLCLLGVAWQMFLGPHRFIVILHFLKGAKSQSLRAMHSLNSHFLFIMEQLKVKYLLIANGRKVNIFHHSKEHKVASHIISIIKRSSRAKTIGPLLLLCLILTFSILIIIPSNSGWIFSSIRAIKSFSNR